MEGFGHLLFSFRGNITRMQFFIGIVFLWLSLLFFQFSIEFLMDISGAEPLVLTLGSGLVSIFATWMSLALYLKRYSHIGIAKPITFLIYCGLFVYMGYLLIDIFRSADAPSTLVEAVTKSVKPTKNVVTALFMLYYFIIPLIWPGKRYRHIY